MAKALLFLIAEGGDIDGLQSTLAAALEERFTDQAQVTVQLMRQPEMDFFYNPESPHPRPDLVLEIITSPGKPLGSLTDTLQGALAGAPVDSASMALLMQERKFVPSPPQPVYYHYLMIRHPDFTHADYMDYYSNYHCRMGLNTPNVSGYSQNYIDQAGSEALARSLGLSCREVTSISELKMPDAEKFVSSPEVMALAEPAGADEEHFVDRPNSVSFTSEVVLRLGDFDQIDEAVFEQHFQCQGL